MLLDRVGGKGWITRTGPFHGAVAVSETSKARLSADFLGQEHSSISMNIINIININIINRVSIMIKVFHLIFWHSLNFDMGWNLTVVGNFSSWSRLLFLCVHTRARNTGVIIYILYADFMFHFIGYFQPLRMSLTVLHQRGFKVCLAYKHLVPYHWTFRFSQFFSY